MKQVTFYKFEKENNSNALDFRVSMRLPPKEVNPLPKLGNFTCPTFMSSSAWAAAGRADDTEWVKLLHRFANIPSPIRECSATF